jgi:signal transduction histidine kinase
MGLNITWDELISVLETKGYYENEFSALTKDGKQFYADVYVKRMCAVSGEFFGTVATFRDITNHKLVEQVNFECKEQARFLADELEKKNKLITDFYINISHELKTPISILLLGIDLLEKEAEKQKDVVYPSTFHFIEGTERFDDPFQQAEYSYSLIESEVQ